MEIILTLQYGATTAKIMEMPPYSFFAVIGLVFSLSLFILLLSKYDYNILQYTKIFLFSSSGLLVGAKLFGFITGLYKALANNETITINTFLNTGIVFYGGLIGYILTFLLICKKWNGEIEHGVVDIVVVCIPLFHLWARTGCFFAGCCYGVESSSLFSIVYTTNINHEAVTALRFPVQLAEAVGNAVLFIVLISLLFKRKLEGCLLIVYLSSYAIMRIVLEFLRGDLVRGVWNGVSFSQVVSVVILAICIILVIANKSKSKERICNSLKGF